MAQAQALIWVVARRGTFADAGRANAYREDFQALGPGNREPPALASDALRFLRFARIPSAFDRRFLDDEPLRRSDLPRAPLPI